MMSVEFPVNCNNEASRWSFSTKLNEVLRLWHNEQCAGKTAKEADRWRKANFYPKIKTVMQARNEQIEVARIGGFWNPKVPDHVSGGIINYPSGLDQDNEGSRAVFLFGLEIKVIKEMDKEVIRGGLAQAKKDAIENNYWSPVLEDIE